MTCLRPSLLTLAVVLVLGACATASAQTTNTPAASLAGPEPVALSIFRMLGALALVLSVFLGGLWLFRNWQRLLPQRGPAPKLNVLEVKSLGQRHALYVVAYEQQRMLLAASPTGVTMLTHLPAASTEPEAEPPGTPPPHFALALLQAVTRKS